MSDPILSVVIVNWNSGGQLLTCVESVINHGAGLVGKVIVVDNGSVDGSDLAVGEVLGVSLIRAGENLGFGRACNVGAGHAEDEYILFLNPDAALYPDTLSKALEYMRNPANARVGICGVQLHDSTGDVSRSCSRFPSPGGVVAHAFALDRFLPRLGAAMDEWDHADTRSVDQVIGAFFLVRRDVFEALNGFDERFFVYFEEVDFSYRARMAGWQSVYLAAAQAFHLGGGTSNQVKARRLFYSLRSRLLYAFKHFSLSGKFVVVLASLFVEPLTRSGQATARRSWVGLKEIWSAYGMLWQWLPQWFFKGVTR